SARVALALAQPVDVVGRESHRERGRALEADGHPGGALDRAREPGVERGTQPPKRRERKGVRIRFGRDRQHASGNAGSFAPRLAALEQRHLVTALGQPPRRGEPDHAASDHDDSTQPCAPSRPGPGFPRRPPAAASACRPPAVARSASQCSFMSRVATATSGAALMAWITTIQRAPVAAISGSRASLTPPLTVQGRLRFWPAQRAYPIPTL